jgi:lysozyme
MLPAARPQATRTQILAALRRQWRKNGPGGGDFPEFVVGFVRGYYLRSMGDPGRNDRGIYDDAAFIITPHVFAGFNANADPSARYRPGVASLLPGCYPYKPGLHGISRPTTAYPAFRPATRGEALPVTRDGDPDVPSKRPGIAINIHRGSTSTTSSEGCLTIPPGQWLAFHSLLTAELRREELGRFWVVLTEGV